MSTPIKAGADAMRATALAVVDQLYASEAPVPFAQGALAILIGSLAKALGHDVVNMLLVEQLALTQAHEALVASKCEVKH